MHSKPKGYRDTRLVMCGGPEGIIPDLPGAYLVDALFKVGPTEWRGGEECAISWAELAAYGQATGAVAEPWEYEAVMAMSRAYLKAKVEAAGDVFCIAPVDREGAA